MKTDHEAVVTAMYQNDDAEDMENHHHPHQYINARTGHTRRIRVGAVDYEVPSVEYVQQLEQMVTQQAQTVLQQRRVIDRIANMMLKTRHSQVGHIRAMDELRRELAKKITMRDFSS